MLQIGCVLMAGGQSTRFGADKLLQPLGGRPLLCHTLSQLPLERLNRTVSVAGSPEAEALCRAAGLETVLSIGGAQSRTIRLGLEHMAGMDGCMFVMGDQPLCTRRSMEALLDAFLRSPEAIIRLSWQGEPSSPTLFPSRYFPHLSALTGERGGMAAVRGLSPEIRLIEAGSADELWDCDTPGDLLRIQSFLEK